MRTFSLFAPCRSGEHRTSAVRLEIAAAAHSMPMTHPNTATRAALSALDLVAWPVAAVPAEKPQ
ncbi:hypothetical protein [Nocardia asiatica]|uniref:hypothetical protein n=1 Tax=Nocardia asiatica TaxID=209252 RepID=UPI0003132886|nr:hypothetical protein [Nocardia asiatica]